MSQVIFCEDAVRAARGMNEAAQQMSTAIAGIGDSIERLRRISEEHIAALDRLSESLRAALEPKKGM